MSGNIEPTTQQLETLMGLGLAGPVTMLNLLRFRDSADYSASPELAPSSPISGRDAYGLYSASVLPIVAGLGGEVVLYGACHPTLIGPSDEQFDDIAVIRYPDLDAFAAMVAMPEYLAVVGHRTAALSDSRLIPTGAETLPTVP